MILRTLIDVYISDDDKVILLLNALSKSFKTLEDTMLYGRDHAITLEAKSRRFYKLSRLDKSHCDEGPKQRKLLTEEIRIYSVSSL